MIPAQLDYVRPGTLDEALRILADREGEAKLLSGGYSLIPLIKLRLAQPALLVDIQAIDRPRRHRGERRRPADRRARHPPPDRRDAGHRRPVPGHPRASGGIGDPQVRNWGTIGGSVAHAIRRPTGRPSSSPSTRRSCVAAPNGDREIKARDFFLDTFTTAIEPTEVLTEVRSRTPAGPRRRLHEARAQGRRLRHGRGRGARPDRRRRRFDSAGIGVTGVSASPYAATEAEATLIGKRAVRRRRSAPPGARRRGQSQPGRRRPRARRVQAGHGRRADPSIPPDAPPSAPSRSTGRRAMTTTQHVALTVNGQPARPTSSPACCSSTSSATMFGLTGTHIGCDTCNCGACTVHLNGRSAKSCTMLAVQADGAEIETIEGMDRRRQAPPAPAGVLGPARPAVRLLHPRA